MRGFSEKATYDASDRLLWRMSRYEIGRVPRTKLPFEGNVTIVEISRSFSAGVVSDALWKSGRQLL
jgi:hypothetical protein